MKSGIAVGVAENASPEVADVDWDDRGIRAFRHLFEAAVELLDPPGSRQFSFGVDGEQFAATQSVAGRIYRSDEHLGVVRSVYLDCAGEPEEGAAPLP
ncbi:MAG: hypothetical protein IJK54_06375 [Clostridia bacterium]|nr:hypothetical protein [Clostridia bacterium]